MDKEYFMTLYGLPEKVHFCKKCVMSNQRPSSTQEFKHTLKSKKHSMHINEDGVCDACKTAETKKHIDWRQREEELLKLLDKYRSKDGRFDCIVPGSGGKDSAYQAHILKNKYGMNPLTITWSPMLYTDYGKKNFENWLAIGGFQNKSYQADEQVMKTLTKLSILNLLHPFQTFILGQKNLAPKVAADLGIKLVFYGENEAEYGNPIAENNSSLRDKSYFSYKNKEDMYLGGVSIKELKEKYFFSDQQLSPFLPIEERRLDKDELEVHYLGYYLKWIPQEAYYYAVEHTGFKARPFRTQGTYSKYNSIDDKIDDLHYYTTYIKFGLGRATYDASQEIRNNHITREEAIQLVKKYDGEFPDRYFKEVMEYLDIEPELFHQTCDKFRSPHLWEKLNGTWQLKKPIWGPSL
jgi:N-acetyl sugar amidotransferase